MIWTSSGPNGLGLAQLFLTNVSFLSFYFFLFVSVSSSSPDLPAPVLASPHLSYCPLLSLPLSHYHWSFVLPYPNSDRIAHELWVLLRHSIDSPLIILSGLWNEGSLLHPGQQTHRDMLVQWRIHQHKTHRYSVHHHCTLWSQLSLPPERLDEIQYCLFCQLETS